MHFTTLFVLKNEELENLTKGEIEQIFGERFCYSCGETKPKYRFWCDWFVIGGRWGDILKAKKGIRGERSRSWNLTEKIHKDKYSIVNIHDLTEPLPRDEIYSVATKSKIILKNCDWNYGNVDEEKFNQMLDDIDNKKFKGVIALIDCHD